MIWANILEILIELTEVSLWVLLIEGSAKRSFRRSYCISSTRVLTKEEGAYLTVIKRSIDAQTVYYMINQRKSVSVKGSISQIESLSITLGY